MEIYEIHGATPTAELSRPDPETEARTSVAVLPFVNLSGSPSDEYFSDGMTDELIAVLSRQRGLRVISRTSAFSVKDSGLGARAIARLLNVQTILEGSVRKSNGRVRLSARLVRAEDEVQLWSETFDRELDDVFAIQEEIAQAIARALQVELLGGVTRYGDVATRDMAAYTLYLKGRYCWAQRSERSLKRAVAYFRRAIEVNPSYALAYSGLADALTVLPDYAAFPREEAHHRALEAAQKALSLDDELAEAYASLADVKLLYEWDWRGAEQGFQRAIRLRPSYGTAYHWYAHCLLYTGRFEEAYVWLEQALELDPLSVIAHANRGLALYALGDHKRALAALHQATGLAPEFGIAEVYLGLVHCALGQLEEARSHFSSAEVNLGQKSVLAEIGCAVVEASIEGHDSARRRMEQVQERHHAHEPFCIAAGYAGIGDAHEAFRWLEEAFRKRDTMLRFIQVLHLFDALHDDPRYREILDRMGLLSAAPPA